MWHAEPVLIDAAGVEAKKGRLGTINAR